MRTIEARWRNKALPAARAGAGTMQRPQNFAGRRETLPSSVAFAAGGEFSPDEMNGQGEQGEKKQDVDAPVGNMANEDFNDPGD